ncbi:hypothetical protein ACFTXO_32620, partial [Streptomyces sp. NPDC057067]
ETLSDTAWALQHPSRPPLSKPGQVSPIRAAVPIRILLAAGLNTDLIREVLPCMVDEGAILAPTCAEMAQDLKHERERLSRSIEQLQAAQVMLGSIIHAGEAIASRGGRSR